MNHQYSILPFIKALFFLLLIYFPIFLHLDVLPINLWDESRLAHSTLEMLHNHKWLVPYFGGAEDTWSTKPPLMIWIQVLFVKILGVRELSFRLPSALSAAFTCMILMGYCIRYFKSYLLGLLTCAVLVTTTGYIALHVTRTCEYDALLILEMLVYALAFFRYTETAHSKWLYVFFTALILGGLTKGIAALIPLPSLVLYALLSKNMLSLLKNKHLYIGIGLFLLWVGGYFVWREMLCPGYLQLVWQNDMGGRFMEEKENWGRDWYIKLIISEYFSYWLWGIPLGLYIGYANKDSHIQRLTLFSFCFAAFYLLVISLSMTKLTWYAAPLYPFFALWTAIAIRHFFYAIKNASWFNDTLKYPFFAETLLIIMFISPYIHILSQVYFPVYSNDALKKGGYEISDWLRKKAQQKADLSNFVICNEGYAPHIEFYTQYFTTVPIKSVAQLAVGENVIVYQKQLKKTIKMHFILDSLESKKYMKIWKIVGRK